ncbi:MAG TPA: DUF3662 and FHA domain-containing protein [Solirubrobacteraceae bacterium]|nr:DUF3662 and FHA domain-containing protein [Solirubrobacteraceae bacterium]
MSVLRNLESKLAGLVEGTFGRVFRTEVRPVELARRLAREMDEHTTVSLSRTYAPNEYVVWLSPDDRERYAGIEHEVCDELCAYLLEHARAERLALVATPVITFETDERLGLGEFGIETRVVHAEPAPVHDEAPPQRVPAPAAAPPSGHTMVLSTSERVQERLGEARAVRRGRAILGAEGKRFAIGPAGALVGRSRECDVVLGDSNVSRRHARITFDEAAGWTIEDLGSTNGVQVNGRRITEPQPLRSGDRLDIGTVSARFEVE